jgi:phosphatidylglycerophosphatase A
MEPTERPTAQLDSQVPRGMTRWAAVALSTGLGVGFIPGAPGTYGSALAILIFVLFSPLPGGLLLVSGLALGAVGVWSADVAEAVFQRSDDGRIVIDEIVGQLLALAPLLVLSAPSALPESAGSAAVPEIVWLVTGFVAFRCLDITKPGPVGWAERQFSGGLGVMMDDVVAGGLAAVILATAMLVVPSLLAGAAG